MWIRICRVVFGGMIRGRGRKEINEELTFPAETTSTTVRVLIGWVYVREPPIGLVGD